MHRVIFVLGGPGSGKSTECKLLERDLGAIHISAGDLLRRELSRGGERADLIRMIMTKGKLVPSEWTVELIKQEMDLRASAFDGSSILFIVDGFPRSVANWETWASMGHKTHLERVIALECNEETMLARILGRGQARPDDELMTIRKRFESNVRDTEPVLALFESMGKLVRVDSCYAPDVVHSVVMGLFQ